MDWNKWITIIALLALFASVGIPIAQKKYEEWKARISFKLYLKKYFGVIFNILTYDKIEYTNPSTKDDPEKLKLDLLSFLTHFEADFREYQNTLQYRIAFSLLLNLQSLFMVINRIQLAIMDIEVDSLYDHTLEYGNNLTKKDLNRIYGILLLMEHFNSITTFHDRFAELKTINRVMKGKSITGLKVEKALLQSQQMVMEDLKYVSKNELSLEEIFKVNKLIIQELLVFYDFKKLIKKHKH